MVMELLGEILLKQKLISEQQLADIIALQKSKKTRLGDIIIAENIINYKQLYSAIAEQNGLVFIDLLQDAPDKELITIHEIRNYLNFRAMPWKKENNKIIVAVAEYNYDTKKWIKDNFGEGAEIAITSPFDIRKTIENIFGEFLEEESKLKLWKKNPEESARDTAYSQNIFLILLLLLSALLFIKFPVNSIVAILAVCNIFYLCGWIIKVIVFSNGIPENPKPDWIKLLSELDEESLPIYTILVPMYEEKESLPALLAAIWRIDYPKEKLDIKLILEADDSGTYEAAIALKPGYNFDIIRVPHSDIRTKPKACNYALRFARGAYVTIFDADDIPNILQLKKSVVTFRLQPDDVVCLQAKLAYYNYDDNWLTNFFALEYSILFDVLLHGLERLKIPLPLGGTSNHFSLAKLQELGEWDAYNVTEDADLGVRLAAYGFRTKMLDSHTLEEAPNSIMAWIRQRSRWVKGYLQTYLVHMRRPLKLYRKLGARAFWGFQFFIGFSSFAFFTAPFLWLFTIIFYFLPHNVTENFLPQWLLMIMVTNLLLNFIIHWLMLTYCVSLREESSAKYKMAALFYPLYLILHSIASYRALGQLISNPHFWEKTAHGLARSRNITENG